MILGVETAKSSPTIIIKEESLLIGQFCSSHRLLSDSSLYLG